MNQAALWTGQPGAFWAHLASRPNAKSLNWRVTLIEPGFILKTEKPEKILEEWESHRLALCRTTTLPIPPLFAFQNSTKPFYIAMGEIRGVTLDSRLASLTTLELNHIASQLTSFLAELRAIKGDGGIGGVTGRPLTSAFFDYMRPPRYFKNVGDFYAHIIECFHAQSCKYGQAPPDDRKEAWEKQFMAKLPAAVVQGRPRAVHFTHGDLGPTNILVDTSGSTITGIIDWGMAAWLPDYWEYVRMKQWGSQDATKTRHWHHIVDTVFPVTEELEHQFQGYSDLEYEMQSSGLGYL